MDLILWRHADAQMLPPEGPQDVAADRARELTREGREQAARMAAWLNPHLPASTRIIVSPAQRTQQTAAALGRPFETCEAIASGAPVEALLQAAGWPGAPGTVLVVGHQPTLGLTAARLLTGLELRWSVRRAAVWWLRGRMREGRDQAELLAVQAPEFC